MALILNKGDLRKLSVIEALRKDMVVLSSDAYLHECVSAMIKHKFGAVLIESLAGHDCGIISKTDIIMAYYSSIPLDIVAQEIMVTKIVSCFEYDPLDFAITKMLQEDIKQLVVLDKEHIQVGILSFSDIVGLIYKVCFECKRNLFKASNHEQEKEWIRVKDVMSINVKSIDSGSSIAQALEIILGQHISALPVIAPDKRLIGVVSKTDLMLAYRHGVGLDVAVNEIMSVPPIVCDFNTYLTEAIKILILADVDRIFVEDPDKTVLGVLSFTDAAKFKSGSCKACRAGNW